jgi:hypothetical protein
MLKLSLKSPSLSPLIPSLRGIQKLKKIYQILAQGLRVIIVVVLVGAVKIYVAAVEALRKKERGVETHAHFR